MFIYKGIATFFGIGFIGKGSGTVASIAFCLLLYLIVINNLFTQASLAVFTVITFVIGVFVSNKLESIWGEDSKMIVIDEVHGMAVGLLFVPVVDVVTIALGLLLFRYFDIFKPLFIRKTENLKGGWGVMVDDLVAGIYTNIILQLFVYFFYKNHVVIS